MLDSRSVPLDKPVFVGLWYGHPGNLHLKYYKLVVVQSLSLVQLFVTPWTVARQAPLPFTISPSLLKLMSTESVLPSISSSVTPFSSCLRSFPASGSFPMSQFFKSGGQSIVALASAPVLPMSIQSSFPLGLTGLISLQSKGLSSLFHHYSSKS